MAFGSIKKRQLPSGALRYDVIVDLEPGADGKRRQRSTTFQTKKEALRHLAAVRAAINEGRHVDRNPQTVNELVHFWLESHGKNNLRPTTLQKYEHDLTQYLLPSIGAVAAQKLTAARVQETYNELVAAGVGRRTLEQTHQVFCQILDSAITMGVLIRNVAKDARPPRRERRQMQTWDRDEVRRYLAGACEHRYAPLWEMALATGLRRGELLGLRWDDIDGAAAVLHVRQQQVAIHHSGIGYVITYGPPKTEASLRTIGLPVPLLKALCLHRARQTAQREAADNWPSPQLVFTTRYGGAILPQTLTKEHAELCRAAGVRHIRIHDLRHTFATLALDAGMPVTALSEILGHTNVAITMRIYAHALKEQHERLPRLMEGILYGP